MKKGFTSVIMTAYIQNHIQQNMTTLAVANVTKYTDPEDYELILMSDNEKDQVRDYGDGSTSPYKIDQYVRTEDMGYTKSMNEGAKIANGEYLMFIQNDVFVHEGWLKGLRWYLENGYDLVYPEQPPRTREFVLKSYEMTMEEGAHLGGRDEGLWAMTREAYDKMGGFDEDLSLLHARSLYKRIDKANLKVAQTCKVIISHIRGATNRQQLEDDYDGYNKRMDHDAEILND